MEKIDVFVVGGGGTGSDVTYQLAGEGLSVVMAEREHLGGECSKFGCDPTKAMLKSARVAALARRAGEFGVRVPSVEVDFDAVMRRVRRLVDEETSAGASIFEERGARVFMQEARLIDEHRVELADGTVFDAGSIVLATGSVPSAPPIEGLEQGGYWTNREAIWQTEGIPGSLLVLGSGAIGVEFAQIYSRFGAGVTVVEALDRALPAEDEDSSEEIERVLRAEGIEVLTGARVNSAERTGEGWRLQLEGRDPLEADRLLVATGRRPCFDGHDLEAAGIELDERERPILTETLRTTNPRVWAGGDSTGELLFTHVGGYEAGVISADVLGKPFPRDYRVVPRVTFCEPEVASVGLTEADARDQGRTVVRGLARFSESTRAFLEGDPAGLVKIVADAKTGEVLGGHIVGDHAGELIAEVIAAMAGRVPAGVIGAAIHPYPTLSEAVAQAMREAGGFIGAGLIVERPNADIMETVDTDIAPIAVTDRAAEKAVQLAHREGFDRAFLRLRVVAGGCSGFSYKLSFEGEPAGDDHVIEANELRVLIDPRSVPIVSGSTLEFSDEMLGGGFKVNNPQAVHECACGDSFSV